MLMDWICQLAKAGRDIGKDIRRVRGTLLSERELAQHGTCAGHKFSFSCAQSDRQSGLPFRNSHGLELRGSELLRLLRAGGGRGRAMRDCVRCASFLAYVKSLLHAKAASRHVWWYAPSSFLGCHRLVIFAVLNGTRRMSLFVARLRADPRRALESYNRAPCTSR